MITASHLSKSFGTTIAHKDLSFEVKQGEVLGYLGPNVAGKSTTMRILTCYHPADSGTATIAGFDVVAMADGGEAIRHLSENPAGVDAVLLDMTMPGMSGEETYRGLREVSNDLPVVVASGYSEQDAMDRFDDPRPAAYLQKPYRLSDLKAAIDRARGRA